MKRRFKAKTGSSGVGGRENIEDVGVGVAVTDGRRRRRRRLLSIKCAKID